MEIHTFASGPFETNVYLAYCPESKEAVIIDPAPGSADRLIHFIEEKKLVPKAIWLTHSHWDHIADVAPLKKKYAIDVWIHPDDKENLENPGSDGLPSWIAIEAVTPDHFFEEGDTLSLGKQRFTVIHTPGHTPGGVALYCEKANILISGDTLFHGSIGNLSFQTAEPERMWTSLDKLAKLPKETDVLPGHGPKTTIGNESWLPNAREIFK